MPKRLTALAMFLAACSAEAFPTLDAAPADGGVAPPSDSPADDGDPSRDAGASGCGSDCAGCCEGDVCIAEPAEPLCGIGGIACFRCGPGEACWAGACLRAICAGCFDASGACIESPIASACGSGGATCMPCALGEACVDGRCVATDCASRCGGCCDGETCLAGDEADACGAPGSACVACPLQHVCAAHACAPEPGSLWDLIVIDAEVAGVRRDGSAWDPFDGAPDVRVDVNIMSGTYEGSTTVADDTASPVYAEIVIPAIPLEILERHGGSFVVKDVDVFEDEWISSFAIIPIPGWDLSARPLQMAPPSGPVTSLRIRFAPHVP